MTSDHSANLSALDRRYIWHPFTQQQGWSHEDAPIITEAHGVTLVDTNGNEYIDGCSSLWCNVHGHRHPTIDAAVREQLDRVAHTTMLGLSHEPAIRLAERLIEIAPDGLSRVFYSDSGSTATEVAVKIAYQYWQQVGHPQKNRFISLRDAYHGDTLGSVSVGGIDLFHSTYRPLLFETLTAESGEIVDMRRLLAEHGHEVAAVIIEPLVQGAAGMLTHPTGYLREVRALCDQYDVLLILDEVATGFGRTGTMFACNQEGVTPDLMCVAKGITGGYLPLAATFTTEKLYEAFLGEHEEFKTFFHGHTYTANPLGCAAAIASLNVFENEHTMDHVAELCVQIGRLLKPIEELDRVAEIRRRGLMVGIELSGFPLEARSGHQVTLAARKRGAIIRPLGDVVVLMPPLSITAAELERLVGIVRESIEEVIAGAAENKSAAARAKVTV